MITKKYDLVKYMILKSDHIKTNMSKGNLLKEFFPLSFKKKNDEITRGLSVNESDKKICNHIVTLNPKNLKDRDPKYHITLVWDLDQTLISADGIDDEDDNDPDTKLVIRPHAVEVLEILRRNHQVEFIIWTAGSKCHAERVIGSFPNMMFDYVIARDSSWYVEKNPVKNLNIISSNNRTLESIILIDDRMDIGKETPENLLIVPPYYPKKYYASNDKTLLYLVNIIQRAINLYLRNKSKNFSSYLYSPLVEKCVEEDKDINYYYGVKCFESMDELMERLTEFKRRH